MERITISIDDDLLEEINDQLEYGDSRSEWFAVAARQRLQDESDDDCFQPATAD
jgi:metal-responsive CopG/Arc/MetJ family transcriptional regulator